MVSAFKVLLVLLPLAFAAEEAGQGWSYDNIGEWARDYPKCIGLRQSPIHLQTWKAFSPALPAIRFYNYDVPLSGNVVLTNNGHSIEFAVTPTINGRLPSISGGSLPGLFEAVGAHFHWGSGSFKGAEHVINNRRYDAELHIVHKNVKYSTVAEATQQPDGLAVLGIMLDISRTPSVTSPGLQLIFDNLDKLVNYKSTVPLNIQFPLSHLLGNVNTQNYFTYSGSLTTPDCSEAVTWTVFPTSLQIPLEQMQKFWSLLSSDNTRLINNFRPVQPRYGRPVYYVEE